MNVAPAGSLGRRPTTTREAIEKASLDLLASRSYDDVSVALLAENAGVSRATYFRYFPTKASVVWWGFDRAIDRLEESLRQVADDVDTLAAVRAAIADSVHAGVDEQGVWWERFVLLDTAPSLRGEGAERWERWRRAVAVFVAARMGLDADHAVPAAVAGAHYGAYLASLRTWDGRPGDPEEMLVRMLDQLQVIGGALEGLLRHGAAAGSEVTQSCSSTP